jgi:hypothetical protein
VRALREVVVVGRHLELSAVAIDQREIDGGAAVVLGALHGATGGVLDRLSDVAIVRDQLPELLLHRERPVAVPHLEAETGGAQAGLDPRQPLGGVAPEQAARHRIDHYLGEVLLARVPHVDRDRRIDGRDVDQIVRFAGRRGIGRRDWLRSPFARRRSPVARRLFLCSFLCPACDEREREQQDPHGANATTLGSDRRQIHPSTAS